MRRGSWGCAALLTFACTVAVAADPAPPAPPRGDVRVIPPLADRPLDASEGAPIATAGFFVQGVGNHPELGVSPASTQRLADGLFELISGGEPLSVSSALARAGERRAAPVITHRGPAPARGRTGLDIDHLGAVTLEVDNSTGTTNASASGLLTRNSDDSLIIGAVLGDGVRITTDGDVFIGTGGLIEGRAGEVNIAAAGGSNTVLANNVGAIQSSFEERVSFKLDSSQFATETRIFSIEGTGVLPPEDQRE